MGPDDGDDQHECELGGDPPCWEGRIVDQRDLARSEADARVRRDPPAVER